MPCGDNPSPNTDHVSLHVNTPFYYCRPAFTKRVWHYTAWFQRQGDFQVQSAVALSLVYIPLIPRYSVQGHKVQYLMAVNCVVWKVACPFERCWHLFRGTVGESVIYVAPYAYFRLLLVIKAQKPSQAQISELYSLFQNTWENVYLKMIRCKLYLQVIKHTIHPNNKIR